MTLLITTGCGGGGPTVLREASEEDLRYLVLQDGDAGESFEWIDDGLSGGPLPDGRTFQNFIYQVSFKGKGESGDIVCINDDAQLIDLGTAADHFEQARETIIEASADAERELEILELQGLVNDSFAYHLGEREPNCPFETSGSAHMYAVMFHRSNILAFLAVWSEPEIGAAVAVDLVKKQVQRIEAILEDSSND